MKIQVKYQQFQADAAKAVCDVFAGQPYLESSYLMDSGTTKLFGGSVPGWSEGDTSPIHITKQRVMLKATYSEADTITRNPDRTSGT